MTVDQSVALLPTTLMGNLSRAENSFHQSNVDHDFTLASIHDSSPQLRTSFLSGLCPPPGGATWKLARQVGHDSDRDRDAMDRLHEGRGSRKRLDSHGSR